MDLLVTRQIEGLRDAMRLQQSTLAQDPARMSYAELICSLQSTCEAVALLCEMLLLDRPTR